MGRRQERSGEVRICGNVILSLIQKKVVIRSANTKFLLYVLHILNTRQCS